MTDPFEVILRELDYYLGENSKEVDYSIRLGPQNEFGN